MGTENLKHGAWIPSKISCEKYVCSECGGACWYYDVNKTVSKSPYCPNCGAKMAEMAEPSENGFVKIRQDDLEQAIEQAYQDGKEDARREIMGDYYEVIKNMRRPQDIPALDEMMKKYAQQPISRG